MQMEHSALEQQQTGTASGLKDTELKTADACKYGC